MRKIHKQVLVVGGGPVGLTLGMDLARRGIEVALIEMRSFGELPSVRSNHVSARSMEIFRRLGAVDAIRNAGLPADYPNDVSFRVTTTGNEMSRIPIPCRQDRYTAVDGPDARWPTPEPAHRLNQIYLEPVLREHAVGFDKLTALYRTRVDYIMEDEGSAFAKATALDTGEEIEIACDYLVGCDGSRSMVRRTIGARLQGDLVVQRVQSTYISAPDLIGAMKAPPAWCMFSLNPRRSGNVYAIDGRERWLIHNYLGQDEPDFESVSRDASIRAILGVDDRFRYQVLKKEDWIGRRLVADRFRDGRILICGDAAHLWIPMAGYGMNAGIADAADLSWLLAGTILGWGGPRLLDAYEAERHPINDQASRFAMSHAVDLAKQRRDVSPEIEDDGPGGDAARETLGQAAYALNVDQFCCGGLNFGYFYGNSPIIAYDGEQQPSYSTANFVSSIVPGCRAPHFWLDDGRSFYEALGPDYTLLRLEPHAKLQSLSEAAELRGVPLAVLDVSRATAGDAYDRSLVLIRPDQHVAWRGDALPENVDGLIDLISGQETSFKVVR